MKITVCGKGGSGKSTVSTLLAREYASQGKRVLVIDGDESNFGLAQMLGKSQPKEYIDDMGGKMANMPALANAPFNIPPFFSERWTMGSLPDGGAPEPGEVKLMNIGKIHTANEGCACIFNAVLAQLVDNLDLAENDVAIMDMEAGIEHFGRGTDNATDVIVMIVDPTAESVKLAAKVHEIGIQLGKPVYYVLNKLEEGDAEVVRSGLDDPSLVAAEIRADRDIRRAGLEGSVLESDIEEIGELAAKFAV